MKEGQVGICVETFIKSKLLSAIGVGDGRSFSSPGGSFRTSDRFIVDPSTGSVGSNQQPGNGVGYTLGRFHGFGFASHSAQTSSLINLRGEAMNGLGTPPYSISYDMNISVSKSGQVSLAGGAHDGFPSYEIWVYRVGQEPQRLYAYPESGNMLDLRPPMEVKVP